MLMLMQILGNKYEGRDENLGLALFILSSHSQNPQIGWVLKRQIKGNSREILAFSRLPQCPIFIPQCYWAFVSRQLY